MGIQQTSLQAYLSISEEQLNQSQKQVLTILKQYDNLLDSEISLLLDWRINRVTPRRNELVKANKVVQDCIRECLCDWCNRNLAKGMKPVHRRGIAWRVV